MKKTLSILVISLLVLSTIFAGPLTHAGGATIWTDKADYAYNETVTVFGSGFEALANVTVAIVMPNDTSDIVCALTDAAGNFTCTYQLNGIAGTYTVAATDGTNTATTTFTEAAITPNLWGYTLEPSPKWTKGDVKGYYECQWVPYKIEIESNKKDSYQLTVIVQHDYFEGTWYGLDNDRNFQMWRNGVPETPTISGPAIDGWESGIQQLQFSWIFTINKDDNCTLSFETHIAIGAHNYPGSKVHTHIHDITSVPDTPISSGNRDVPIVVKGAPPEADVAIAKTGVNYAHEGDTIFYQFTVTNNGPSTAYNVQVIDDVLGDLTGHLPDTTLDSGEVNTFSVNYVVPSPSGDIRNNVTLTSTTPDPNSANNNATWTVDVLHPGISVSKSGPFYAHECDTITYTITVTNTGDCQLYSVFVTDTLLGPIYSNGLAVGETKTFTVSYHVPTPSGDIGNTVIASGYDALGRQVSDSDSWTVDVLHPGIYVTKTANATQVHYCDWVEYTITVENIGDCPLYVVKDDPTLGLHWEGLLAPGEIHVEKKIFHPENDPTTNIVTVTGTDELGKTVLGNASCTVDILHPKISVSKSGPLYAHESDTIAYTITVSNTGDCKLYDVLVTDTLLGPIWTGDLDKEATLTFTLSYHVPTPSTLISNTVSATGHDILCMQVSDTANWSVVVLHPGIRVTKTGPLRAHEGETITYTITITNTGDCPLFSVFVTDTLLGPIYSNGLALGETKTFTVSYHVPTPSGDISNTVTASGSDILGLSVLDIDSWFVKIQYYLTVKTDPMGLIPAPVGEGWYDRCTVVWLRAPAVSYLGTIEYVFVYWDVDGIEASDNPITVHMDTNHTATAHYELPVPHHLDAEPPRLIDLTKPVCTQWDELYPDFGRPYHLESWHDTNGNGILDPSDYIDLWDNDHQWKVQPYWWHVDDVTVTLKVSKKPYLNESMYIEFDGFTDCGWPGYYKVIQQPECSTWFEVWPQYIPSPVFHIEQWFDNCDSKLSPSDQIILHNELTSERVEYHVDAVKTDLIISPRATEIYPCKTKQNLGQGYPQIIPVHINSYELNTTTFTVYAYYDGLQPIGSQAITLDPLESGDLFITWAEVATWPKGNYAFNITVIVHFPDSTTIVITFPIAFKIGTPGDLNCDGKIDVKDVATAAKAFGTTLCQPRWNPDADINNDSKVDIKDIAFIAKHFGDIDP